MKLPPFLERVFKSKSGRLTDKLRLKQNRQLGLIPARYDSNNIQKSICGYCSTGCQLDIHTKSSRPVLLTPDTNHPVNLGMACPKGWEALEPLNAPDRGRVPLIRDVDHTFRQAEWPEALDYFCQRFKEIQNQHGNESVAFLGTGQITNEELALMGALAKFGMGWVHGDGNTRQCMASAVTAYKESFGFDAPPYTYADLELSDTLIFIGANPCIAHPILWHRVMRNPHRPKIIVIDPRATETTAAATTHLAIRPKSDLTLLYAIANILIQNDWIDHSYIDQHTELFDAFARFVKSYSIDRAVEATELPASSVIGLASKIHEGKAVSFWWTMGVNQSYQGTRTAQAIINLALMTGNIGRPGTGANSITGQCNAMGSRLFSNTTSLFCGRDFENPVDREDIGNRLNIPVDRIPNKKSLPYHEIMKGIEKGDIKGLWIVATNPGHSWIDQSRWFKSIRSKLEFLVVQDMYESTETAQEADLFLPAAGWGEKSGTFINSERRFGVIEKVQDPVGEARSDFDIFKDIADHWGCGELFEHWKTPEDVFQILKTLSKHTPCDFSGIKDYSMLQKNGGIQWPHIQNQQNGDLPEKERRLFEDGRFHHPNGRAHFVFEETTPNPESVCPNFPVWLLTGRGTSAQWHTQTRTAKSKMLRQMAPGSVYVDLHPADARELGIKTNDLVVIRSRRGSLEAHARVQASVQQGQIFIPMHYPEVNQLTHPSFDPYSHQPSYKACAVSLSKRT